MESFHDTLWEFTSADVDRKNRLKQAATRCMPVLGSVLGASLVQGRADVASFEPMKDILAQLRLEIGDLIESQEDFNELFGILVVEYVEHRFAGYVEDPQFPEFFSLFLENLEKGIGEFCTLIEFKVPHLRIMNTTRRLISNAIQGASVDFERSSHDALTGLLKKDVFERVRRREMERLFRHGKGWVLAQLFIDLDKFKTLNDHHGHHAGDEGLVRVSQVLKDRLRSTDVVGRLGGDEFGVLALVQTEAEAVELAEKVRRTVEQLFEDDPVQLTLSVGVGVCNPNGLRDSLPRGQVKFWLDEAAKRLGEESDQAMLVAKRVCGRNNVVCFSNLEEEEYERAKAADAIEGAERRVRK